MAGPAAPACGLFLMKVSYQKVGQLKNYCKNIRQNRIILILQMFFSGQDILKLGVEELSKLLNNVKNI